VNEDGVVCIRKYIDHDNTSATEQAQKDFCFELPTVVGGVRLSRPCLRKVINTTLNENDKLDELIKRYNLYTEYNDSLEGKNELYEEYKYSLVDRSLKAENFYNKIMNLVIGVRQTADKTIIKYLDYKGVVETKTYENNTSRAELEKTIEQDFSGTEFSGRGEYTVLCKDLPNSYGGIKLKKQVLKSCLYRLKEGDTVDDLLRIYNETIGEEIKDYKEAIGE
jgi:hypothetical protein